MSYELIALDMDGTLLNSNKQISSVDADAVNEALAKGKHVVLSTGRCLGELREFFPLLPKMRYLISESGSCIYDIEKEEALLQRNINKDIVKAVVDFVKGKDILPQFLMHGESVLPKSCLQELDRYYMSQYQDHFKKNGFFVDDVLAYCEEKDYVVEKICLYHLTKEAREETLAFCKDFDASLVFAEETSLELTHPLADKGLGLKWLSDHLGLSLSQCIAVGDSFNDESILKVAGLSVSMGNGKSEIKSLCDEIVYDNDHGGVAMAIRRFLLGRG